MIQRGHSLPKGVVCHNDKAGAIPPGAIGVLEEGISVGPPRDEGGVGGLGGDNRGVEVHSGNDIEK